MTDERRTYEAQRMELRTYEPNSQMDVLRNAVRTEQARSDLLWELAIRRGWVSAEEDTVARVRVA